MYNNWFKRHDSHDIIAHETDHIDTEIILLWILLADIVNGIVTEVYASHKESDWMFILFVTVLPLGVYIIAGILSLLYEYINAHAVQVTAVNTSIHAYAYQNQPK